MQHVNQTRRRTPIRRRVFLCIMLACVAPIHAQDVATPPADPESQPTTESIAATIQQQTVRTALERAATQIADRQFAAALQTLKPVDPLEPDNPWLHFYRGAAHQGLQNWYPAMESYDNAMDLLLSYGDPEPELFKTIQQYRTQARRNVFSMSLSTGIAWDSNVSYVGDAGSQADLISGQGDAVINTRFNIAYAPIANETETLVLAARTFNTWHTDLDQFDQQNYGFTANYVRKIDDHWSWSLRYDYDVVYLGLQPFVSSHAITPSLFHRWEPTDAPFQPTTTNFYYRFEAHDYLFRTPSEFDRDGYDNGVGLSQGFVWQPNRDNPWAMTIDTGYEFEFVATEGSEFDQMRHNFFLSVGLPLTNPLLPDKDLLWTINANCEIGDYREASLIDRDGDERYDVITTLESVFSQRLISHPTRGDLTMHAIVGWSHAASNVTREDRSSPFSYEKWISGVQFEWNW